MTLSNNNNNNNKTRQTTQRPDADNKIVQRKCKSKDQKSFMV